MSDQPFEMTWAPTAQRDLRRLPEKVATAVIEFVYGGLADNPRRVGRELDLELSGLHAARRGDFRVIYRINDKQRRVTLIAIDHRADIYRRR